MGIISDQSTEPGPSLRGLVPPMITPLADRDRLDHQGLERLIEHMLAGAIDGLFVLGTTGEAAGLTPMLQKELIGRTCRQVADRVPVLVGVTDTRTQASVELARHAADAGAFAAVVSVPYYITPEQTELMHYIHSILDEQPLPVFLYNIPSLTKVWYEVETVVRLAENPRILGLKDSSGDIQYLWELKEKIARRDFGLFMGVEALLSEAIRGGAHGGVCGGANIAPRLFTDLYAAARQDDETHIQSLNRRVAMLDRIYRLGSGVGSIIRGIKCAMSLMGICSDRMAEPFRRCDEHERVAIRRCLESLSLLPGHAPVEVRVAPAVSRHIRMRGVPGTSAAE